MGNINITIQQAYYGEVNRSHGCLATTIKDSDLRSFLTAFTDRPGSLTAGTPLSAYYSGMSHGDNYVLTRTIADGTASRGGMVFTHALIIRSADLHSINDLSKLFLYFATEKPAASVSLTPLVIAGGEFAEKLVQIPPSIYLQKVVSGLVANQGPVLFCGELDSFEKVLSTIWSGLPSSFRKGLSFTTAFSTNALDVEKKLIYVQKELLSVFRNSNTVTDDEITAAAELSEVEKFILSQDDENEFDTFIRSLEVDLNDWAILAPCVRAYHLYAKIGGAITADELRLLIRNIAKISPGAGSGTVIKTSAISKLSQLISDGTDTNLKALRNLGLQEFAGGSEILSNAIRELLAGMFTKRIPTAVEVIDELFLTVQPATATTWWQKAIAAALSAAGLSKKPIPIEIFWSLLNREDAPAAAILGYLDKSAETEEMLIKNLPAALNARSSATIAKLIQPRKWFLLHARLIKTYGEYKEAVIHQFNYESANHASLFPGTRYLLPELNDNDLLLVCFQTSNELFINTYAERAVINPFLLRAINLNKSVWLAIWSVSLDKTKDLSHGITDPDKVVSNLFDLMLKDNSLPNNILTLIAASPYVDITDHDHRPLLWKKFPASLAAKFLTATARGFVTKVVSGTITSPPENELTEAIEQDAFMTRFLSDHRSDMAAVLNLYDVVRGLKDKFLADYVSYFQSDLSELLSLRLGELVLAKGFRITARQVFEKAKYQQTFKVALLKCKSLITLGFWDKLFHGSVLGETVSEAAVYEELLATAIKHYDKGPDDKDIWKRAGGDNGKLSNNRTREESWRDAISLLHRGGGGKHLSVQGLIKVMEEDFPQSNELRELKKYFKK